MTVKELIEKLKEFDENLEVGGSGHYGELLRIHDVYVAKEDILDMDGNDRTKQFVEITIQYAGPEPD